MMTFFPLRIFLASSSAWEAGTMVGDPFSNKRDRCVVVAQHQFHLVQLEVGAGVAQGRQDAAEVRVGPEDRRLDQAG